VQQPRVDTDFIFVDQMGWRVMTTCGLSTSQPNGGIVPLGCTKTRTQCVQY
jgi:hypothetical protein